MRGDNSLLIIGSQLINIRRMMELEHYHLATSIIIFFFSFWPWHVVCGILFPQLGTEPRPSAVKAQSPNHWTTREFSIIVAT